METVLARDAESRPRHATRGHFVATYHYVRERDSDGVTGITPHAFRAQVRAIRDHYEIVSAEEYSARAGREDGLALITFDDAVKDQALAAEILDELGVPGVFFAPMRPYSEEVDPWCAQHLLHALAQHLGWAEFERRAMALLGDVEIDVARMNALYHYEVPYKRRLKYALAFAVPPARASQILREMNAGVGLRADEWYMSESDLRSLQDRGHALGGHGFDHVPYTLLTPTEQAADMRRAAETMTGLFGDRPRMLAYPFGRFDATTKELTRECGYTTAFSTADRVDAKFVMDELARRKQEGA
ncbi:MAG: polysaccharide deacetylase family protein [Planctomycetes bacterium]|nr:polysaccharide deacetylase family protein [Planctomycetota bacterium]